jgi:hypothetical protein
MQPTAETHGCRMLTINLLFNYWVWLILCKYSIPSLTTTANCQHFHTVPLYIQVNASQCSLNLFFVATATSQCCLMYFGTYFWQTTTKSHLLPLPGSHCLLTCQRAVRNINQILRSRQHPESIFFKEQHMNEFYWVKGAQKKSMRETHQQSIWRFGR